MRSELLACRMTDTLCSSIKHVQTLYCCPVFTSADFMVECCYIILAVRSFQCSFDVAKRKFYSAFIAIYGRIGRSASEEVTLNLISAKCIPCLLYASEALPLSSAQLKSLNFSAKRVLFKIFKRTFNHCTFQLLPLTL